MQQLTNRIFRVIAHGQRETPNPLALPQNSLASPLILLAYFQFIKDQHF
jgi:hypothetical protein